jgi:hypothetical protein
MKNPRYYLPWVLIGLLWLVFLAVALLIYTTHPNGAGDYGYYYRGVSRILDGRPLYADLQSSDYVGPPLQVQLMTPLVAVARDERTSARLWFALNIVLLTGTLALLSRFITRRHHRLILWAVTPLFAPTLMSFWMGQITIVLLAATAGAWAAYRTGRPRLAGVLLALAVWTKFYPGLLVLYFLWKREWRVVFSAAVTTLLAIIFQMAVSGADTFVYYLLNVLPNLTAEGQPALNHSNNAILGFAQKLFSESPQIIPLLVSPALVTLTRFGLLFGLGGLTLYLISRPAAMSRTPAEKFDLEYAAVLLVALLAGSTLGIHGMLSALLVYIVLFRERYGLSPRQRTRLKMLSLVSALLINLHMPIILGYLQPPSDNTLPALALALPFFGMMLIWGLVMWLLSRQRAAV